MTLSRRPEARLNRGRVATVVGAGSPPGGPLFVTLSAPAAASTIPINDTQTISGTCNAWAALGSDWSAGWFGTDSRHPLQAGYVEIATHATHGIIPAISSYLATIG